MSSSASNTTSTAAASAAAPPRTTGSHGSGAAAAFAPPDLGEVLVEVDPAVLDAQPQLVAVANEGSHEGPARAV